MVDASDADGLLRKIRDFREGLDENEREMFASLLAPGIAMALAGDEVTAFAQQPFSPLALALADAVRRSGLRVVGFTAEE